MTPDLKRLCEAAEATAEREGLAFPFERSGSEAIVRAVLTALREPSAEMMFAARHRLYRYRHGDEPDMFDTTPLAFAAAIDEVLTPSPAVARMVSALGRDIFRGSATQE